MARIPDLKCVERKSCETPKQQLQFHVLSGGGGGGGGGGGVIPLVLPVLSTRSDVYHTCKNLLSMSPSTALIVLVESQINSISSVKSRI